MMKNVLMIAILVVASVSTAAASAGVGEKAPEFAVTSLDGRKISLSSNPTGRPTFLVFWASWCPACQQEAARLNDLYARLGSKGIGFVGINPGINDSLRRIEGFVDAYKVSYPIVLDAGGPITRMYEVRGVPTFVLVDKAGVIRYRGNALTEELDKLFQEVAD